MPKADCLCCLFRDKKYHKMKFGKEIQEKLTSEWRSEYVDYRKLKNIITSFEEGKEGRADIKLKMIKSMMSAEIISREKERVSAEFFEAQEHQLLKVNLFFNEKVQLLFSPSLLHKSGLQISLKIRLRSGAKAKIFSRKIAKRSEAKIFFVCAKRSEANNF